MTNQTQYFTVFGGSYVPEHHASDERLDADGRRTRKRDPSAVASWIVFCTLVAGISVFAAEISFFASGANRWLEAGLMQ